jgi:hypothetical protein
MEFIMRRWKNTDANWFNGNCYWFAHILTARFPELKIYYLPIEGHFIAGKDELYFDAAGPYTVGTKPIYDFEALKDWDFNLYIRLIQDCVN